MSKSSVMGNAYEYQELMQAAFAFGTTKTIDEVAAEHKAKHDLDERNSGRGRHSTKTAGGSSPFAGRRPTAAPSKAATPKPTEMDKVRAMLAAGTQRTVPLVDPDAQ